MASSDLITKQAAAQRDPSAGLVNGDDALGIVLYATAQITIPALVEVGTKLRLIPKEMVPLGGVVIPQLCHVFLATDPGTALVLDVGTATNDDAFADALSLTVPGLVSFAASGTVPVGIATPYRFTKQEEIFATVKTSTAVDATVATFTIAYRAKA
jgi:hypothetical protein